MSTSDAIVDGGLAKKFVIACGLVPGALLLWDATHGGLGVNSVNFAIRTTGLVGLVLLTLSLVITPLRVLTGMAWLVAARRNLGVLGFGYIAAHFLIFVVLDRDGSISSTVEEIVERRYLWFGTAALLLMVPLALTSFDGMVTWLGAKRWKRLHRLAYLVVLGGLVHYFLLVKADTTKPFVFTVLFGGLMLFRVVDALRPKPAPKRPWSGELVVERVTQETHDVKTFRLAAPPFTHVAGQYLQLTLTIDGKRVYRNYTIASAPGQPFVEITVKRIGVGSTHLHDTVKAGDTLHVRAALGDFVFRGTEAKRVLLVAGGVGITPMMSVIRALTARAWRGDIDLVYCARTEGDLIFDAELADLERRHPNLRVHRHLSGARGRITAAELAPHAGDHPAMLCGPDLMMASVRAMLTDLGMRDIREEKFASPIAPTEATTGTVQFARANKRVDAPGLTVLECAEDAGVDIAFECRAGVCGQCKTKLVSGRVVMAAQDALTAGDRAKGLVLACQARPVTDVVVDA